MPLTQPKQLNSVRAQQAVIFYPFQYHFGTQAVDPSLIMNTIRIDATSAVYNLNVQDSKSSVSGSFTITLGPERDWRKRIRPGDWCMIYASQYGIGAYNNPQDTTGLKCLGNVDRITRSRQIGKDGKPRMVYIVSGRNFGKIFEKTQFYFNPFIPEDITLLKIIEDTGFLQIQGSPTDFLTKYFMLYFGSLQQAKTLLVKQAATATNLQGMNVIKELRQCQIPPAIYEVFGLAPGDQNIANLVKLKIGGVDSFQTDLAPEGFSLYINPKTAVDGNVWQIFQAVANLLVNELYTCMKYDADQGKILPTIVLRKIPFGEATYALLPKIQVYDSMITVDDLGYDDHQRINWFNFDFEFFPATYKGLMALSQGRWDGVDPYNTQGNQPLFPYADNASIQRYGFCSAGTQRVNFLNQNIHATNITNPQGVTNITLAEEWMREWIDWYSNWVRCQSGTVVVKGFPSNTQLYLTPNSAVTPSYPVQQSNAPSMAIPNSTGSTLTSVQGQNVNTAPVKKGAQAIVTDTYSIGDNMYFMDRNELFHLEGYNLTWTTPGEMQIAFTLSRGVYSSSISSTTFQYFDELDSSNNPATDLVQKSEAVSSTTKRTQQDDGGGASTAGSGGFDPGPGGAGNIA